MMPHKRKGTAYRKREDVHKMAEANKAFSHLDFNHKNLINYG